MESEPPSGRGEVGSPGGQEERAGGGSRLYGSLATLLHCESCVGVGVGVGMSMCFTLRVSLCWV